MNGQRIDWTDTIFLLAAIVGMVVVLVRSVKLYWDEVNLPRRDKLMIKRLLLDRALVYTLLEPVLEESREEEKARIAKLFSNQLHDFNARNDKIESNRRVGEANADALTFLRATAERQGMELQELATTRQMMQQLNGTMSQLNTTMREVDTSLREVRERLVAVEERTGGVRGDYRGAEKRRTPRDGDGS